MRGDSFRLACPLQHKELRQDCDRFEPDGEGPGELKGGVGVIEDEGEEDDGWDEVSEFEGVEGCVLGWSVSQQAFQVGGLSRVRYRLWSDAPLCVPRYVSFHCPPVVAAMEPHAGKITPQHLLVPPLVA